MKYYREWQDALIDFITVYGQNYTDSYNLSSDFEEILNQNKKGTWFIYWDEAALTVLLNRSI